MTKRLQYRDQNGTVLNIKKCTQLKVKCIFDINFRIIFVVKIRLIIYVLYRVRRDEVGKVAVT